MTFAERLRIARAARPRRWPHLPARHLALWMRDYVQTLRGTYSAEPGPLIRDELMKMTEHVIAARFSSEPPRLVPRELPPLDLGPSFTYRQVDRLPR